MRAVLVVGIVFCLSFASMSNAQERMRIGHNAMGFHPNPCGVGESNIRTYAARSDIEEDVALLLEKAKMHGVQVRESNIKNACALIYNGVRYIVLGQLVDPEGDPQEVGGYNLVVLAHEVGHHVCGHTVGMARERPWDMELQADRYAGFLLGEMFRANQVRGWHESSGDHFLEVVVDMMGIGDEAGSRSHPPASLRKKAVREGFYGGSAC